jgi:tRNA pseudouridine55 synthase
MLMENSPYQEGKLILINKPLGWTSFRVVKKINYLLKGIKVGHAGTLDPLATGLLILCTGKFTKRINEYMAAEKEYTGNFTLGATTPTYDLESEPENFKEFNEITLQNILAVFRQFTGNILQIPPIHSAIKKDGRRAYEMARKGQEVNLAARPVVIREFELVSFEPPQVYFRVVCTTGTYIRSLAHDIGQALGCGAHLSSLCRTRIGEFQVEHAMTIDQIEQEILQNRPIKTDS